MASAPHSITSDGYARMRGIGKSAEARGYEPVSLGEETEEERERRILREKWVSCGNGFSFDNPNRIF